MVLSYMKPVHKVRGGGGGPNSVIAGKLILIEEIFTIILDHSLRGGFELFFRRRSLEGEHIESTGHGLLDKSLH